MMRKQFIMIIALILSCSILTACTPEEKKEETDLVIILAKRANMPLFSIEDIGDDIETIARYGGNISLIISDGQPFEKHFELKSIDEGYSESKKESIVKSRIHSLSEYIEGLNAIHDEADVLTSIKLGSRVLNSYSKDHQKKMIIMDNLLQTVNPLNFSESLLENINIDTTIKNLEKQSYIPHLENIAVDIYYCGDTILPQKALTEKNKDNLQQLWSSILKQGNAKEVQFKTNLPSRDASQKTLPKVTPITILEEEKIMSLDNQAISIDETQIPFVSGTDQLKNKSEAVKILQPIANSLKASNKNISLIGSTAHYGDYKSSIELSKKRANVIRSLLIELGVQKETMEIIAAGYDEANPFRKNDLDKNGQLIENIAKKNRTVIILSSDNPIIQTLKQKLK